MRAAQRNLSQQRTADNSVELLDLAASLKEQLEAAQYRKLPRPRSQGALGRSRSGGRLFPSVRQGSGEAYSGHPQNTCYPTSPLFPNMRQLRSIIHAVQQSLARQQQPQDLDKGLELITAIEELLTPEA